MANWHKLRSEIPRAFEVVSRDVAKESNPNRRRIGKAEASRRLEPLMNLVAAGDIPMDKQTAEAVAAYLEGKGNPK